MRLSEAAIKKFREIYRREYGVDISPERAEEMGIRLLELTQLLLQNPNPDERSDDSVIKG